MRHIVKRYPGVVALNDVSVDIAAGETHALIGENGAGKSTLMKILAGAVEPDDGDILFEGAPEALVALSPRLALTMGIETMYQEFNLLPTLSVAENIFISDLPGRRGLLDRRRMVAMAEALLDEVQLPIDTGAIVSDLSVAQMQLVEIAKAIHRNVKVLVMDEPTAPLTTAETEVLFDVMDRLKRRGVTIVYISHRLGEVFRVADRVTILRDGARVGTYSIAELTRESMIRAMVGRDIQEGSSTRNPPSEEMVLEVEDLSGNGVEGVTFVLHKGEVLGLFGLVGAGRTEIARVLFGADPRTGGTVRLMGRDVALASPLDAVKEGIALVPEDRQRHGVVQSMSIRENVSLPNLRHITRWGVVRRAAERDLVDAQVGQLRIAAPSREQIVRLLSGGNQQKVVLAKWLAGDAKVLILDEPTRGIDVGAKSEIYHLINQLCDEGVSIILISSEMEEIIRMSDRILVLCEGHQTGVLDREAFTQSSLLSLASSQR